MNSSAEPVKSHVYDGSRIQYGTQANKCLTPTMPQNGTGARPRRALSLLGCCGTCEASSVVDCLRKSMHAFPKESTLFVFLVCGIGHSGPVLHKSTGACITPAGRWRSRRPGPCGEINTLKLAFLSPSPRSRTRILPQRGLLQEPALLNTVLCPR